MDSEGMQQDKWARTEFYRMACAMIFAARVSGDPLILELAARGLDIMEHDAVVLSTMAAQRLTNIVFGD